MRINIVAKREAPIGPYQGEMVCIPIPGIPFALGAFWLRSQKYWWTKESEKEGRYIVNEIGVNMLLGCGNLGDKLDRLYMLIDRNENGTLYTYSGDGTPENPYVYNPAIPVVPNNPALYSEPGSKWQTEDLRDMLNNAITGTATADYAEPRGTNVVLEDILAAIGAMDEEDYTALIGKILVALGGVV